MNISLTPELEELVNEKVKSGQYQSASEVIGVGLRLLEERDRLNQTRLAELKEKIRVGIEASAPRSGSLRDRGEVVDGEAVFAELEEDICRIEAGIGRNRHGFEPGF
ncbi:MAG: type II toxin-antitoxin system ParD family antitoxin [Prochloron sp. SP5CPC1]|nr:type II toxin-antitoxin system ParD family antitoxin [Candidatus Paraprochloron terpiosi SP5CPC1]